MFSILCKRSISGFCVISLLEFIPIQLFWARSLYWTRLVAGPSRSSRQTGSGRSDFAGGAGRPGGRLRRVGAGRAGRTGRPSRRGHQSAGAATGPVAGRRRQGSPVPRRSGPFTSVCSRMTLPVELDGTLLFGSMTLRMVAIRADWITSDLSEIRKVATSVAQDISSWSRAIHMSMSELLC